MIAEKAEECPKCGEVKRWLYDAQKCAACGFNEFRQVVSAIQTRDLRFLRAIEQTAHDLLCWTYQDCIDVEPSEYKRHVRQLHPGVFNKMNAAEQNLYNALMRRQAGLEAIRPRDQ